MKTCISEQKQLRIDMQNEGEGENIFQSKESQGKQDPSYSREKFRIYGRVPPASCREVIGKQYINRYWMHQYPSHKHTQRVARDANMTNRLGTPRTSEFCTFAYGASSHRDIDEAVTMGSVLHHSDRV